jgi:ribosomal-protein-alanine N-acetyltransferase
VTSLVTARLQLRPVTESDRETLHAMFTQPGVRRFIFDDQVIEAEQTASIVATSVELFRTSGNGLWIANSAERDASPDAIGFGGFWYFREIAHAIVRYGFDVLRMETIRASTDAVHVESRRLLTSLGFVFEREDVIAGLPTAFFVCRR